MLSIVATALLVTPPAQGALVVFRGSPGAQGDVVRADPTLSTPPVVVPGLSAVTLLPIDATGRLEIDQLRPDVARWRNDVPQASRLSLPAGRGSLYRYSRASGAGLEFGLMLIDAAGDARSVFAMAGAGPALDQPPFVSRIAVAPDGSGALVITTPPAGGNVLQVDFASGAVVDRTASLPPERFLAAGVHLRSTLAVIASPRGVWRFDPSAPGDATPLTFAATAPASFTGEVAFSRSGLWCVTTAGVDADQLDVYVFGVSGDATLVTNAPTRISPAGYQPEFRHGPYMAVSDDGTHCAWRVETAVSTEAFLARVPQATPTPSEHLTQDANFIDTIDEIGDFFFRPGTNVLVFAAGEVAGAGPAVIEAMDLYSALLPTGGGANLLNLTQTSGIASPPFVQPAELSPEFTSLEPGTSRVLMFNSDSGGGDIVAADTSGTGLTVVIPNVKEVQFVERVGADLLVAVRRANGAKPSEILLVDAAWTPTNAPLLSVNTLHVFERFAAGPNGWGAFIERTLTKDRLWRYDPGAGALQLFSDRQLYFGPALSWSAGGELGLTVGQGGVQSIFGAWPQTSAVVRLPIPVGPGFLLPGV